MSLPALGKLASDVRPAEAEDLLEHPPEEEITPLLQPSEKHCSINSSPGTLVVGRKKYPIIEFTIYNGCGPDPVDELFGKPVYIQDFVDIEITFYGDTVKFKYARPSEVRHQKSLLLKLGDLSRRISNFYVKSYEFIESDIARIHLRCHADDFKTVSKKV